MNNVELLSEGWGLIEAPRVDDDNCLYFSDVPNGGVYRRRADGEIETVIPKRRGVGGMVFHSDGGLVVGGRTIRGEADPVGEHYAVIDFGCHLIWTQTPQLAARVVCVLVEGVNL